MRKAIVLGLVALFVIASQAPSQAAGRLRSVRLVNNSRPNIFGRIMEFERRKNEWLFGR